MNKVINRLFENSLSLYDFVSLYTIAILASNISLWFLVLIVPNMYFSGKMLNKVSK